MPQGTRTVYSNEYWHAVLHREMENSQSKIGLRLSALVNSNPRPSMILQNPDLSKALKQVTSKALAGMAS